MPDAAGMQGALRGCPESDVLGPWDANPVVKRKQHPLLDSLGIERRGLHAFRHANGSLTDRLQAPLKTRQERLGHAPGCDITFRLSNRSTKDVSLKSSTPTQ